MWRSAIHRTRKRVQGLGDAEFANAEYAAARDAYRAALKLDPANTAIAQRADICDRILELDPDLPGLSAARRYERSRTMLATVLDELARCGGAVDNDKSAVQQAQAAVARKTRPPSYGDAADLNRALARQLWVAKPASCAIKADDPLSWLMPK